MLQHERVHSRLSGKTLKFHIMQMMKMGIVKSIHAGVSRKLILFVSMFIFFINPCQLLSYDFLFIFYYDIFD